MVGRDQEVVRVLAVQGKCADMGLLLQFGRSLRDHYRGRRCRQR